MIDRATIVELIRIAAYVNDDGKVETIISDTQKLINFVDTAREEIRQQREPLAEKRQPLRLNLGVSPLVSGA